MSLLEHDLGGARRWTTVRDGYDVTKKPRGLNRKDFDAIPFAAMEAIPQGGAFAPEFTLKAPNEIVSGTYFEKGDLLVGKITPSFENGKQGLIQTLPSEFGYATTEVIPLHSVAEGHDPRFLFYYLLHPDVRQYVTERMEGSTGRKRVPEDVLLDLPVPDFDPIEQTVTADALERIQAAITKEENCLTTAQALKRAAMRALFTKGLKGEPQKETPIGPIPESWELRELGDHFQIKHGFAFSGELFRPSGKYTLLTPGHFSEEGGFRDQGEKTKFFVGSFDDQYLLKPGDLLVVMTEQKSGLLGSAAFIPEHGFYLHNQRLGLIADLDDTRLVLGYLYHLFNSQLVRSEISRTATGSKVKHTSPSKMRSVLAPFPTLDEQREIVAILSAVDAKIDLHRKKRAVLDELFRALLHNLMTGEIAVTDLNLDALTLDNEAAA